MRALFLSRWFPWPADNGSKLRILGLISTLAEEFTVDLITFTENPVSESQIAELRSYCENVSWIPYKKYDPRSLRSLVGIFSTMPRFLVDTYNREFEQRIVKYISEHDYDIVIISQIDMTPYIPLLKGKTVIIDELEVTILYEAGRKWSKNLRDIRNWVTWIKHRQYVKRMLQMVKGCSVTSEIERELIQKIMPLPIRIKVVPNGINFETYQRDWGVVEPDSLVYAGSITYFANLDAVNFFIQEILPLIIQQRPEAKLYVTGGFDEKLKSKLPDSKSVVFTGYLEDVRPRIASSWISVVPLRIGGGTRLKILESLALGTPVISTNKGVEGLDLIPGREIIVADNPKDFSSEVLWVLADHERRKKLSEMGKKAVMEKYDWRKIGNTFLDFVRDIIRNQTNSLYG